MPLVALQECRTDNKLSLITSCVVSLREAHANADRVSSDSSGIAESLNECERPLPTVSALRDVSRTGYWMAAIGGDPLSPCMRLRN